MVRRALVTGGAGFIGSHLVDRLLSDCLEVIAVDNLSSGRLSNLAAAKDRPGFSLHCLDVADLNGIRTLFDGVDWVFHLAGLADLVPSIEKPFEYHRANVDGTISVLESARAAGVKRFVFAASSSCYGLPEAFPTAETAPIRPMHPYALTKYLAEWYVLAWAHIYRLPSISLRLFNVYGPRSRTTGAYGAVFGVFLAQKLAGKPLTVVGDGRQLRDFIFVTDVVDAFVKAAESNLFGEVFNVGSGQPESINRLAGLLDGEVVYIRRRPGEPDRTHADITKINRSLGWHPRVSFQEGVNTVMSHIEDWRDAPVWDERSINEATREWFSSLSGVSDVQGRQ